MVIAVTGASGSIYAKVLFDKIISLKKQVTQVGVIMSENAKLVWKHEMENEDFKKYPFRFYEKNDFMAPFASGSAGFDAMIICPCSVGTLGRIAGGMSDDLITRAADVLLKERKKLVLVVRETPYNYIHVKNMETVTLAGGIICPATPSFYSRPKTFEELAATVVDRALTLVGLQVKKFEWGQKSSGK